ncbi:CBS domain-containing protein [Steroidobacter denitrificans]|uniref:CBS domain-containing protein n=1 Tax=Steroidobacter denitrificans TaxID=465721 RepID=UPI000829C1B3|nr:CBS domain-containing protein [Steroidobacter denitrificans]
MRLQEIMNTEVVTIGPEATANQAWTLMERKRIRHLLVMEEGHLVGVISERDLGGRKGSAVRRGRKVEELMVEETASASPRTTLRQAANLMRSRLIGSLPVLEDGRIVGIVTATDVLEELGRGSTRPAVQAKRRSMRLAPVATRRKSPAKQVGTAKRGRSIAKQIKRSAKSKRGSARDSGGGDPPARRSKTDAPTRAPMAARVPRRAKQLAGRTASAEVPVHIRAAGTQLEPSDRDYIRRKLGRKLGKFATSIERVSVRVEDINGPRGGIDKRCRIKVVLSGLPSVMAEERHDTVQAAVDAALTTAERAVRQPVRRRRMQPMRRRNTSKLHTLDLV